MMYSAQIRAMCLGVVVGMIVLIARDVMCAEDKEMVTILGTGTASCGRFIQQRNEYVFFTVWVEGYITAVNIITPDTGNILGNTDIYGAMSWIENYCKNNPLKDFSLAVYYLVKELYPNSITKVPRR